MKFFSITMNKILLHSVFVLISYSLQAQWAIVSTGGNDTAGGYILSTSVGELVVDDAAIAGYRLKFGVQQPAAFPWPGTRMWGRVAYASNPTVPLGQVTLILIQNGTVIGTTTTSNSGDFDLGMRGSGSYALEFVSDAPWRGVNGTDALVVMRHFAGTAMLSGLRLQAGNVNNQMPVNSQDALRVIQRTVDRSLTFPSGNWAFGATGITVNTGDAAVHIPVPALCYGDVNASYFPVFRPLLLVWRGTPCLRSVVWMNRIPIPGNGRFI
jgi:hypothetical protein